MSARIIERGRGPEIEGTRITVYRILDYLAENAPVDRIARELDLTADEVQVALDYIADHQAEVDAEYAKILDRMRQGNPPWVKALLAKSVDEIKQRILDRRGKDLTHADSRGQ